MQRIILVFLAVVLVSCGSDERAPTPVTTANAPPPRIVAGNPQFADSDPVEFEGPKPWHYPIHGVDVARYQAGLDFDRLRENRISFAFIKATEGTDLLDPEFNTHWNRARAAGVAAGAYHFAYWCSPMSDQADWFIRNVPKSGLPPVLDVEWNHLSPTCRTRPAPEVVREEMRVFLRKVEAAFGKKPIIYTTPDFYERNEIWKINGYPFWLRAVARPLSEIYPGERWVFWQYTGTGRVPGAPGNIDLNVFHGSEALWAQWLAANGR